MDFQHSIGIRCPYLLLTAVKVVVPQMRKLISNLEKSCTYTFTKGKGSSCLSKTALEYVTELQMSFWELKHNFFSILMQKSL